MTNIQPVRDPDQQDTNGTSFKRPAVSVLCTVLNGERYLDQTIRSVLGQEFTDLELVLFDDGSTDRTREIAMAYEHDPRIRYIYHSNIAQSGVAFDRLLNTCMQYVIGEYVAFIGADDIFMPRKLSVQVSTLKDDADVDIVFSDGTHIDAEGRILPTDFRSQEALVFTGRNLLRLLYSKNIVPHPTVLMRRRVIEELGGFESGFCPDYQFWLKAAAARRRFKYIDEKLVQYRVHAQGISTGPMSKTGPETVKLLAAMRARISIQDLFPECVECADQQHARYGAHVEFGLLLLTANIPCPQLALEEFRHAAEERGDGLEAINNLGVLLALYGLYDKSEKCFQFVHANEKMPWAFEHNLQVLRKIAAGSHVREGFFLLRQSPDDQELLRRIDRVPDAVLKQRPYADKIAGILVHKREWIGGEPCQPDVKPSMLLPQTLESANPQAPMVSVIIPTHNRPRQLRRAVASVLEQIHENYELIIVNDAGCEVEGDLAGMNAAGRITYVRHATNRGMAAARNTGLRLARGKYIAYLDDDDRFLPIHLHTLVRYLETHDERVAYTDAWRIHEQLHDTEYIETGRDLPYSYDFDATRLLISNYFPVLSVMHERACVEKTGLFDESLTTHEDWDFWIRMSRWYPFKHLKKVTAEFTWRTDGSSTTSSRRPDFSRTAAIIYEKYRKVSEAIPGVREMQAQAIKELQMLTRVEPAYTCSVVIPVWNKVELTRQCVIALASSTTDVSFEVIVVDNGSTDGTEELLTELKGDIQIIRNHENLGFAKACNQGARAARGKYLVFLNNDTIPQVNWLTALVREVEEHPEVSIVGSKLLFADGSVQHAGVVFMRSHLSAYHIYRAASSTIPAVNRRREFQAVTAACMLIRREVFEAVHGFDEGFINGFEDVDLCLKVREQGHQVIYQPRSVLYHLESQTPGRNDHDEHNSRLLQGRWGNHWWLGDEDFHYHTDGFKLLGGADNKRFATQLRPMSDVPEQAAWAHVAAAQAAALKKDWEAVKWELRMVDNWPNDRFVLSWAAMVCGRLHEPSLQVKFLSRYLELVDDLTVRLQVIRELLEQRDLGAAEGHLQKLMTNCPTHAEGQLLKGILDMQREQYEQAETAFDLAIRQGADRKKCLMGMGMAALGRAYNQGAWERFTQVLADHPDNAEVIHWLLRAGTAQNRWQELGEHLRSYVERNPSDLAIRFAFVSVLLRGEQIEAARREYDALQQVAPGYDGLDQLGQAITGREAALALDAASS